MMTIAMVASAILLAVAALIVHHEMRIRGLNARVVRAIAGVPGQAQPLQDTMTWLSALGTRYRRFYSTENLEELRTVVQSSGFNHHRMMPVLLGSKTVSMFAFPLVAILLVQFSDLDTGSRLMVIGLSVAVGIMLPRLVLRMISKRFNKAVQRGTPDAIDLLVVCSQAGMGIESAIERVAQEMDRSNPAMSTVMNGLLDDLRVLPDRRDAFANLGNRTTFEGLRRFGTMVNQSMKYGTPLSDALRAISEELRQDRITKLEERAHKLGAKLTIPMVLFMLPSMFVVLAGSPFLHLMESLHQIGGH
jgi:tight adherence protein C